MNARSDVVFLYYARDAFERDRHLNHIIDILSKCAGYNYLSSRTLFDELLKLISVMKSRDKELNLSDYFIVEFDFKQNKINNIFEADNIVDKDLLETYI